MIRGGLFMREYRRLMLVTVLVVMSVLVFSATPQASQASDAWSVEIVSGKNMISLTQAEMENMPTVTATAGFRKSGGKVEGPFNYKGVYMKDLLDKVGGIKKGQSLRVTSRDGYVRDFSRLEVAGNVLTYDKDGNLLRLGNAEMLLTYESDRDAPIAFPRIIYVSENDKLFTSGPLWMKGIAKLEVVTATDDWEVKLTGIESAVIDRTIFDTIIDCEDSPHLTSVWETMDKKGNPETYEGLPLWVVIAMIDGGDSPDGHYRFNDDLAAQGYRVKLIAKDRYSVMLDAKQIARNNDIFLANKKNGLILTSDMFPLTLAGKGLPFRQYMIKGIAEIQLVNLPKK
jgi:hypothetical protein